MTAKQSRVFALLLLTTLGLIGCASPSEDVVSMDFAKLVERETGSIAKSTITYQGAGEGDSDNVYVHVRFTLLIERNANPGSGWLAGMQVRRGQQLHDGEVVLLYQKTDSSSWQLKQAEIIRKPSPATS